MKGPLPFLLFVAVMLLIWTVPGFAADPIPRGLGHPKAGGSHWYDGNCCNMQDCEPVEMGSIQPKKDGYAVHYISSFGHEVKGFVPYGDPKIRPSKDFQEHGCAGPLTGALFCIYVLTGM